MSKIIDGVKLDYSDVLIVPKRSKTASRSDVSLHRSFKFYHSPQGWGGIPILASNMDTTGTFAMAEALEQVNMTTCLHKHYKAGPLSTWYTERQKNSKYAQHIFYSIGIKENDFFRLEAVDEVLKAKGLPGIESICIDVANGYTEDFVNHCAKVRKRFPDAIIMGGNVCTPEMVQELILHGGVDIVKIGIGPGAVCTTRLVAGVGYPQLSAVMECADVAHGLTNGDKRLGLICADGGISYPGDAAKAFGANADFVMIGGMFAGTDECEGKWERQQFWVPDRFCEAKAEDLPNDCPGQWVNIDGQGIMDQFTPMNHHPIERFRRTSLKFYGMSSYEALAKYNNGEGDYRAAEGKCVSVPYKGAATDVAREIMGGLRSACAYIGTDSIRNMGKCTTFARVNRTHNQTFD